MPQRDPIVGPIDILNFTELFNESYARNVLDPQRAEKLVEVFYERFLSRSARIRELFSQTDMQQQQVHLRRGLLTVGTFVTTGLRPTQEMHRLARVHQAMGLTAADHQDWMDSLIAALSEVEPGMRPEVADAWRICLAPALTFMQLPVPNSDAA